MPTHHAGQALDNSLPTTVSPPIAARGAGRGQWAVVTGAREGESPRQASLLHIYMTAGRAIPHSRHRMYRRSQLSPTLSQDSQPHDTLLGLDLAAESTLEPANVSDCEEGGRNAPFLDQSEPASDALNADGRSKMDQLPVSSHTHGKLQNKGKLVTFYRNGDQHFKGITIPISQKWFVTLETLIVYLNKKISTPTGVRYIFQLSDGQEVRDVTEFQPGESYIVSSVKRLVHNVRYGSASHQYWVNKPPSASKIRKDDNYLFLKNYEEINQTRMSHISVRNSKKPDNMMSVVSKVKHFKKKPASKEIVIISNTNRQSIYVLVVERVNEKKFEDMLYDISDYLKMSDPPIQTLYTASKPYRRVCSFGQLFKEFRLDETFIACGSEFYPVEMKLSKQIMTEEEVTPHQKDSEKDFDTKPNNSNYESKSTQTAEDSPIACKDNPEDTPHAPASGVQVASPQYITVNGRERAVYPTKMASGTSRIKDSHSLSLNWIYGFNADVQDSCLGVINSNEVLYCVGKVAIVYNVAQYQQRYFMEHTSLIDCFTVHPNCKYVASSQSQSQVESLVLIWDTTDCSVLTTISGSLLENVLSLDFSKDNAGDLLMILDCSPNFQNQSIKIFEWSKNLKVAFTKCTKDEVKAGKFHPDDNSILVTFGFQHINVWRVFWQEQGQGKILRDKKSGLFEFCIPDYISCATFDIMGNILSGDSNGSIHLWSMDEEEAFVNRPVPQLYHAHKDLVSCILFIGDGTMITTSNYTIKAWDSFNDFKFVKERNIPLNCGKIRSIVCCHPERIDGKLWIGTDNSFILEGTLQDSFVTLIVNHKNVYNSLLVAAAPKEHYFVSGGSDKQLIKWSLLQKKHAWISSIDNECSAITFSTDGQYIAIGTSSGKLIIMQSKTGTHQMSLQIDPGQKSITCLEYSPSGQYLCVACAKCDLKLLGILDQGAFCHVLTNMEFKNSANIVRMDWSQDSLALRTEDDEYNIRLWSVSTTVIESNPADMVHLDFSSENCLLTFNNLDFWRSQTPDNSLSVVQKARKINQLVYGTTAGSIGLAPHVLQNDSLDNRAAPAGLGGVRSIGVCFDDSYVVSSSDDKSCPSVLQWTVRTGLSN